MALKKKRPSAKRPATRKRPSAERVHPLLERYVPVLDGMLARCVRQEHRLVEVRKAEKRWNALKDVSGTECLDAMAEWVRAEVDYFGAKGCVFGVSGGVDSTLVAVVLQRALKERAVGLIMPQRNADPADEQDAVALLKTLGLPYEVYRLDDGIDGLLRAMGEQPDAAPRRHVGNMAQRVRMAVMYYQASLRGSLVVGSGDLDEVYIGYSSQGLAADLYPITGLHKDEVRALAYAGLAPLDEALAKKLAFRPASPGYWPGHKSEDQIGLPYTRVGHVVDALMHCKADRSGVFPRKLEPFLDQLGEGNVEPSEALHVTDLMLENFSLVGGSPALLRPPGALPLVKQTPPGVRRKAAP